MAEQTDLNYEQELILESRARGALEAVRRILRRQLELRFGPLPPEVILRLEGATLVQLEEAALRISSLNSADELQL